MPTYYLIENNLVQRVLFAKNRKQAATKVLRLEPYDIDTTGKKRLLVRSQVEEVLLSKREWFSLQAWGQATKLALK